MTPEFLREHFEPKKIEKTMTRVNHRWKERPNALRYKEVFGETPTKFMNAIRVFLGLRPLIDEVRKAEK